MDGCVELAPSVSGLLDWDGRLHNRRDLLRRLGTPIDADAADPAIAAAVYRRWGVPGLAHLVGDWSLVIRDRDAVVLASDFLGVRPLYYSRRRQRLAWSSQVEPLAAALSADVDDESYVAGYLLFGGLPTRTPFKHVRAVPAGHAVRVTPDATTVEAFWAPPAGQTRARQDPHGDSDQLRALFEEAVAVRLDTRAPVLAELSGGLDSSSVVCMAHRLTSAGSVTADRLRTISYVHRDSFDVPFIRDVETAIGAAGVHLSTHDHPLVSEVASDAATLAAWGPLHQTVAAAARSAGARVLLTGQGGDLAMGNWFDDSLQVAGLLRRGRLGRACVEAMAWSRVTRTPAAWILGRSLQALLPPRWAPAGIYTPERAAVEHAGTSLSARFLARSGVADSRRVFSGDWMAAAPERRKPLRALSMMRELRLLQVPEALHGFDYTHPFAHRPLIEFAMSLPSGVLCGPGAPRRLMRRALGDLWPQSLRARRSKSLFATPWMDGLRAVASRWLAGPAWHVVDRGWVDRASLAARLERLMSGLPCNESQLRQIVLLESWLRHRDGRRGVDLRTA